MESRNNRLEELRLLCQKITETEQGYSIWEHGNAEKRQLIHGVQKELRELQISVALVQLDLTASHEITDKVSSLTIDGKTKDLRHLILDLVSDLEQYLSSIDRTKPDMDFVERSIKTISILIELLDFLER